MSPERRPADAHRLLLRALRARAGDATLGRARSEAWASATFRGTRHEVALSFSGGEAAGRADKVSSEMEGLEFDLPGHLVADIAVAGREDDAAGTVTLRIEALTVENG